jgi:hypothetical protein
LVIAASGVVTTLWKLNLRSTCTLLIVDVNAAESLDSPGAARDCTLEVDNRIRPAYF